MRRRGTSTATPSNLFELLLNYKVSPFAHRIVETPVLMTLAAGDNITSADLEAEAFNAIINPNKTFASVQGVDHMSLYTDRSHLAKVGVVQKAWLETQLVYPGKDLIDLLRASMEARSLSFSGR